MKYHKILISVFFLFLVSLYSNPLQDIEKLQLDGRFEAFFSNSQSYIRQNPDGLYTEILLQQLHQMSDKFKHMESLTNSLLFLLKNSKDDFLKFQVRYNLAEIYFAKGNTEQGEFYIRLNGYMTNWKTLGPFHFLGPADLQIPLAYEKKNFADDGIYRNNFSELKFQKLPPFSQSGLMAPFSASPFDSGIMYAVSYIYVPADDIYHIALQSSDPFVLFINKQKVCVKNKQGKNTFLTISLKSGWHSVVLKFFKYSSFSYFRFAFTDKHWQVLPSVRSDLEPKSINQNVQTEPFLSSSQKIISDKIHSLTSDSTFYFMKSLYADFNSEPDVFYHYIKRALSLSPDNDVYKIYFAERMIEGNEYDNSERLQKAVAYLRNMADSGYPMVYNLLGVYYANHNYTKEAVRNLRKAASLNPDCFLFHFDLARFYYAEKWYKEFLDSEEKAEALNPRFVPSYKLLIDYYQYDNHDLTVKNYEKMITADVFSYNNLDFIKYLIQTGDFRRALTVSEKLQNYFSFIPSLELKKAEIMMSQHQTNAVRRLYNKLLAQFPNVPYVLKQVSDAFFFQHEFSEGLSVLKKASELEPQNRSLLDKLHLYQNNENFSLDSYLQYADSKKSVPKLLASVKRDNQSPAVFLDDEEVLYINPNGTYHKLIYQIIKIQNKNGIEKWANASIDYYPRMKIIQAQTFTPDGEIIDVHNIKQQNSKYVLSFPSVSPGAVLVLKYLITGRWNRVAQTFDFYSERKLFGKIEDDTLHQFYTIITPAYLPYQFKQYHFRKDIVTEKYKKAGKQITKFSAHHLKGLKNENSLPSLYDLLPSFYVFAFPDSRKEFALWYEGLINFYSDDSDEVGEKLFSLSHNPNLKNAGLELIKNVYYWINKNIKIDSYALFSPEPSRRVIDSRSASIENKTLLMKHFLDKMNIPSEIVLIRTSDMPAADLDSFNPSLFNDILLKLQFQTNTYYLDFSSRYFKFGDYGWDRFHVKGFNIKTLQTETIPALKNDNNISLSYSIHLNKASEWEAPVSVTGTRQFGGCYTVYKDYFKDEDTRNAVVSQIENRTFTGFDINNTVFTAVSNNEQYFSYTAEGVLQDWLKKSGTNLIVPFLCKKNQLGQKFIAEKERLLPLQIKTPIHNKQKTVLFLSDAGPISLPAKVVLREKFSDNALSVYELSYSLSEDKKTLIAESRLDLPQQIISREDYKRFLKFCQTVDRAEQTEIMLSPIRK